MEQITLNEMKTRYNGRKKPLFKLGLWTAFLTLITLGIYRFWARTRVRKYLWSAIAPGDHALEYNGTGTEKFLGFLIAVAVLAIYLGFFQLIITFFGYSLLQEPESTADFIIQQVLFYSVILVTLPLIYYAQYRARRYILSRTRWRGIRFGAEPAAWGYVQTALSNLFITVITLGILLPRQTFNLEKFRTDRSWYGNTQFTQEGDWKILLPAMKHVYIGMALLFGGLILLAFGGFQTYMDGTLSFEDENMQDINTGTAIAFGFGTLLLSIGSSWFWVGRMIYGVASWRILANHKTLGDGVRFRSEVDTAEVIMARIFGGMLAGFVALILAGILAFLFGFLANIISNLGDLPYGSEVGPIAGSVFGYLAFFVMFGAIALVAITQPILRSYASNLTILNADELDEIVQRSGDDMVEAEGFADALDVGAAI